MSGVGGPGERYNKNMAMTRLEPEQYIALSVTGHRYIVSPYMLSIFDQWKKKGVLKNTIKKKMLGMICSY